MRCPAFESLIKDMKKNEIDKEHYSFVYNGFQFDTILSIVTGGYEILVAIHTHNWGCVLKMDDDFIVDMPDNKYFELCRILKLNYAEDGFNSSKFLKMLSEKAPKHSNRQGVEYTDLRAYLPYRNVDEAERIYFCGWNDHTRDHRRARNFNKTEFYFGKKVADYCREHNISSLWTDNPRNEINPNNPEE